MFLFLARIGNVGLGLCPLNIRGLVWDLLINLEKGSDYLRSNTEEEASNMRVFADTTSVITQKNDEPPLQQSFRGLEGTELPASSAQS